MGGRRRRRVASRKISARTRDPTGRASRALSICSKRMVACVSGATRAVCAHVDSLTLSVRRHSGRSLVALAGKKINGHRPQVLRASLARLARLSELTLGLGRLSRSSVPASAPMETDCTRTRQNDSPGLLSSLATVWEDLSRLGSSLAHLRYMFILVTAVQLFEYWRPLWHCTAVCPRGRSRC